jgi:hypothetical protein
MLRFGLFPFRSPLLGEYFASHILSKLTEIYAEKRWKNILSALIGVVISMNLKCEVIFGFFSSGY